MAVSAPSRSPGHPQVLATGNDAQPGTPPATSRPRMPPTAASAASTQVTHARSKENKGGEYIINRTNIYSDASAGVLLTNLHALYTRAELLHTPIPLRQRWAGQIEETVAQLHEAGVVWGDAKAENVMIDRNDDAWLIFSGSEYTRGWVDKEKAGTKEGDLQGVARSIGHLDNEPYEEREPYSDSDMDWDMESDQD